MLGKHTEISGAPSSVLGVSKRGSGRGQDYSTSLVFGEGKFEGDAVTRTRAWWLMPLLSPDLLVFILLSLVTLPQGQGLSSLCSFPLPLLSPPFQTGFLGRLSQGTFGSGQQGEVAACRPEQRWGLGRFE